MIDGTTRRQLNNVAVYGAKLHRRALVHVRPPGRLTRALQVVAVFAVLLAIWQAVSPLWSLSVRQVLADPWSVLMYVTHNPASSLNSLRVTTTEAAIGFAAGNVLGLLLGVSCHLFRRVGKTVFPFLVVAQAVPVITLSAIVILWFGNGLSARAALAGYLCFFPMTLNVYRGLETVDRHALKVSRAFGASSTFELLQVKLPQIIPAIFVALRAGVVLAMSGAIVGELFGANAGLGAMLLSGLYYQTSALVWASIFLAGAASLACFGIIAVAQRRLAWW